MHPSSLLSPRALLIAPQLVAPTCGPTYGHPWTPLVCAPSSWPPMVPRLLPKMCPSLEGPIEYCLRGGGGPSAPSHWFHTPPTVRKVLGQPPVSRYGRRHSQADVHGRNPTPAVRLGQSTGTSQTVQCEASGPPRAEQRLEVDCDS